MSDFNQVLVAYLKAVRSQLTPPMLMLLIGPFLLAIAFWALLISMLWAPLTAMISTWLFDSDGWLSGVSVFLADMGLSKARGIIPGLMTFMLTFPLMMGLALIFVSVVAMPIVIRHLARKEYSDIGKHGSFSVSSSAWNVLKAGIIFVVGYLATVPLWLIPPLALIVPLLWWGWLNSRLMRYDSLVEHASHGELKALIMQNRPRYFILGVMVAALNYIPPLFIVAPVFSALAFGHYSLASLREFRRRGRSSGHAGTSIVP